MNDYCKLGLRAYVLTYMRDQQKKDDWGFEFHWIHFDAQDWFSESYDEFMVWSPNDDWSHDANQLREVGLSINIVLGTFSDPEYAQRQAYYVMKRCIEAGTNVRLDVECDRMSSQKDDY